MYNFKFFKVQPEGIIILIDEIFHFSLQFSIQPVELTHRNFKSTFFLEGNILDSHLSVIARTISDRIRLMIMMH